MDCEMLLDYMLLSIGARFAVILYCLCRLIVLVEGWIEW